MTTIKTLHDQARRAVAAGEATLRETAEVSRQSGTGWRDAPERRAYAAPRDLPAVDDELYRLSAALPSLSPAAFGAAVAGC